MHGHCGTSLLPSLLALGASILILSCLTLFCSEPVTETGGAAPLGLVPDRKPPPATRWADATLDRGTELSLTLNSGLSSATARSQDQFKARVARAYMEGNRVVIPEGSIIDGVVEEVTPNATGFGNYGGALVLDFVRVLTPTGTGAFIRARLTKVPDGATLVSSPSGPPVVAGPRGREAVLEEGASIIIALEEPLEIKVRI